MGTNSNYVTTTTSRGGTGHKPYVKENKQFLEHRFFWEADPTTKSTSILTQIQKQAKICRYHSPKALNSIVRDIRT